MKREYPYKAWTLLPSFKPVEVELVREYASMLGYDSWDVTERGRSYSTSTLFPTKRDAVMNGWERVDAMQAKLDKSIVSIQKKRAALQKALGEIGGAA